MDLSRLIDNAVAMRPGRRFGAILGLAPSKGARSPALWRAGFRALGIDADFHPLDVAADRLGPLVAALASCRDFIGGAVAVPYKEAIVAQLGAIEPEARAIGAVNAIYRRDDGVLVGANTDGAAGLGSIEGLYGPVAGKTVLQLGIGGAGRAVAVYLARAGADLRLWNRTRERAERFVAEANGSFPDMRLCDDPVATIAQADLLVNCTSAGFSADGRATEETPLAPVVIDRMKPTAAVFDAIYQPERTALLEAAGRRGLRTRNGREMNLLQAVIAFTKAVRGADPDAVSAAMRDAPR